MSDYSYLCCGGREVPGDNLFVQKIVRFLIDFPTWTLIGIALASLYGMIFIDESRHYSGEPFELAVFLFHAFNFMALIGLYWSRRLYVLIWRMFRRVFRVTSIY